MSEYTDADAFADAELTQLRTALSQSQARTQKTATT